MQLRENQKAEITAARGEGLFRVARAADKAAARRHDVILRSGSSLRRTQRCKCRLGPPRGEGCGRAVLRTAKSITSFHIFLLQKEK